jgi:next-to-BRCA1 protein 1
LLVPASQNLVLERYSDSAGAYVTLNADNPQVYKTLFRAAKAKLKLRLRASVPGQEFLEESRPLRTSKDVTPPEAAPAVLPVIARTPVKEEKKSEVKPTPITGTSAPVEASGEAPVPHPFTTRQSKTDRDLYVNLTLIIYRLLQHFRCFI